MGCEANVYKKAETTAYISLEFVRTFFDVIIVPKIGDWTSHLKTIHLTLFYLETGYCHGMVRVRARASVWDRVRAMVGVRMI